MLLPDCVCGAHSWRPMRVPDHGVLALCECGIARQVSDLSPQEYRAQYDGAYHAATDRHPGCVPYRDRYDNDFRVAGLRWRRLLELAGLKVLDVGAANGAFVDYLRSIGIQAQGIDPDPQSEQVQKGTIADVRGTFHVITYHDVLEHILDPVHELKLARQHLRHGGLLVVDVPFLFYGEGDHHIKPEHLWYFNTSGLDALLTKCGFTAIAVDHPIPGKLVVYAERT